jgi:hypothetical protein
MVRILAARSIDFLRLISCDVGTMPAFIMLNHRGHRVARGKAWPNSLLAVIGLADILMIGHFAVKGQAA